LRRLNGEKYGELCRKFFLESLLERQQEVRPGFDQPGRGPEGNSLEGGGRGLVVTLLADGQSVGCTYERKSFSFTSIPMNLAYKTLLLNAYKHSFSRYVY
jgi:hypothetical protein